ncbi:faciogenital dysplasia protein [Anaeramoeba ignava]|uniref:Faciogenital dysplasia protein n=1 Tax=Anaeramoeba ignava TaxID=1746090 RepID=A0A9Q0LHD5_ANAIG|nr:faciogenital dysplasia protein [Anaeramoeba ignava]
MGIPESTSKNNNNKNKNKNDNKIVNTKNVQMAQFHEEKKPKEYIYSETNSNDPKFIKEKHNKIEKEKHNKIQKEKDNKIQKEKEKEKEKEIEIEKEKEKEKEIEKEIEIQIKKQKEIEIEIQKQKDKLIEEQKLTSVIQSYLKMIQQIKYFKNQKTNAQKIQKRFRGFKTRRKYNFQKLKVKKAVAEELLKTEETYVRFLGYLQDDFEISLEKEKILTKEEHRLLFFGLDVILKYNTVLLETFRQKLAKWNAYSTIGDSFHQIGDFLSAYSDYIKHFNIDKVKKLIKSNQPFDQFLENKKQDPKYNNLSLESMLIMPVQRLPRYLLLLSELLKNTPQEHPDYSMLKASLATLEKRTNDVNSFKEKSDGLEALHRLNEAISPESLEKFHFELISPSRQFAESFDLCLFNKTQKPCSLFLCSDVLLVCFPKKSLFTKKVHYDLVNVIPLLELKIENSSNQELPDFSIQIKFQKTLFIFVAVNLEQKEKIIQNIRKYQHYESKTIRAKKETLQKKHARVLQQIHKNKTKY